jgi:acetyltransferase-like isoleucine patch superfamily enzyme
MNIKLYLLRIRKKILSMLTSPPFLIQSNDYLEAGKMSYHNGNFNIQGDQKIVIGNYCAIGRNVSIITVNHDYNFPCLQETFYNRYFDIIHPGDNQSPPTKTRTKGPVIIGNDVWIAHNVTIMSGVAIGNGACIGNGSIVTRNVEPYSIVAGIPARELKKRYNSDIVKFVESLEWWNWDEEKIIRNKKFFITNLNMISLEQLKGLITS